jgi:cell division protein ZapA
MSEDETQSNPEKAGDQPAQEEMRFPEPKPVAVEIYDQVYRLRGTDPEYLRELAELVDGKMRAVSANGATVDTMRVAVLASLNIADELLGLQQRYDALAGNLQMSERGLRARADSIADMLDEVLEERKAS